MSDSFDDLFETLTGKPPFPWQQHLYTRFVGDEDDNIPRAADIPTGLGKTSVVAVWLLALIRRPDRLPRRLVYVVNRRTVVDQTTAEVERLRENLPRLGSTWFDRMAVSTLRGGFADNEEWREDPSRPAVICGTVDMIGSRLLFAGYRIGFRSRPLHAAFLGQDALLVHDEAHLEPAFQRLVETIQEEQRKERDQAAKPQWPGLRVMALSATTRGNAEQTVTGRPFGLTDEEKLPPPSLPTAPRKPIHHVWRRLTATKSLHLHEIADEKKLAETVSELALRHIDEGTAVLVFVRTIDNINKVCVRLAAKRTGVSSQQICQLTGTMRGYERDQLVTTNPVFGRFMPPDDRSDDLELAIGTVYLVCTSAGEVGVNISADHMVCDLSTFDSMAQRLGRVNRFGEGNDTRVDVVHPASFDNKEPNPQREATLALLRGLKGDASSGALARVPLDQRLAGFAPEPTILPATDILFDNWALTSLTHMVGRPPVAPYLHGVASWEPPTTSVAWREEVDLISGELIEREGPGFPQELLIAYPLKPHELLKDRTDRVHDALSALIADPRKSLTGGARRAALGRAARNRRASVWLIGESGSVDVLDLAKLLEGDKRAIIGRLEHRTVLLPPSIGCLSSGLLSSQSEHANDVADLWLNVEGQPRRSRIWDDSPPPTYEVDGRQRPMALILTVDTDPFADEEEEPSEIQSTTSGPTNEGATRPQRRRFWHWYVRPRDAEEATRASGRPIRLDHHTQDVVRRAVEIVARLNLPAELQRTIVTATELHDIGKGREIWQRSIGNPKPTEWYAKPGKPVNGARWRPRHLSGYRHELGSLLDILHGRARAADLEDLSDEQRDLALHLVAAHHGFARPHFPTEAYDQDSYTERQNQDAVYEVMRRYARLQHRYGRWGLAYLESLVRAADWAASANPSVPEGGT